MGVEGREWFSRLLLISDSAFPTGAFGHSQGLEYAIQRRWVQTRSELVDWTQTALTHAIIPLDARACLKSWKIGVNADDAEWSRLSKEVASMRPSVAQRRGSAEIGGALWRSAIDCFEIDRRIGATMPKLQFPVAWGRICRLLGVPIDETAVTMVLGVIRGWAQVALRIIPLGQRESYRYLAETSKYLEDGRWDWTDQSGRALESLSPGWEIAQIGHQNLQIRSFRS